MSEPDFLEVEPSSAERAAWPEQTAAYVESLEASVKASTLTAAVRDVLAERRRQVEVEGWTPEHDDTHSDGDLATAAGCYALVAGFPESTRPLWTRRNRDGELTPWPNWPWDPSWWKPKSRRYDLIRAAALIVAEIERLDRLEAAPKPTSPPALRMFPLFDEIRLLNCRPGMYVATRLQGVSLRRAIDFLTRAAAVHGHDASLGVVPPADGYPGYVDIRPAEARRG